MVFWRTSKGKKRILLEMLLHLFGAQLGSASSAEEEEQQQRSDDKNLKRCGFF